MSSSETSSPAGVQRNEFRAALLVGQGKLNCLIYAAWARSQRWLNLVGTIGCQDE
jgi:hypothetical protein